MNRRLYRCRHDQRIAGVASGVAEYFDADPSLVRVLWILSFFLGGVGLLLYIAMAIIVPLEPEEGFAAPAARPTRPADPTGDRRGRRPLPHRLALAADGAPSRDPRQRPGDDALRDRPDPVRWPRPRRCVPAGVGGRRALPVARVHRRDRGPPGGDRRATRTDRIVIGGAVLVVGLLLILAGLASARIPGGATFAPSGIAVAPETGDGGTARARPAGAQPDPGVPALPDPPRHVVRQRGDRPRLLRGGLRVRGARLPRLGGFGHDRRRHRRAVHRHGDRGLAARGPDRTPARHARCSRTASWRTRIDRSAAASSRSCGPNSPTRTAGVTCSTSR